jgi:C-terminal processing protease CtpA/Prc
MKKMHILFLMLAILIWSSPTFAQEAKETNKIVIIKKSVDENGVETIEKIIKEGTDSNVLMWNSENGEEMNLDMKNKEGVERQFHIRMNGENGEKSFSWEGNEENMEELKEQLKELDGELRELNIELNELGNENGNLFLNFSKDNLLSSCNDNTVKPFLGVVIKEIIKNENGEESVEGVTEQGVIIEEIVEGSAAEAAGLQAGDIITAIDGQATLRVATVSENVQSKKVGDVVTVSYIRYGKAGQVTATLKGKAAPGFGQTRIRDFKRGHHFNFDFDFDYQVDPCKVFIGVYTSNGNSKDGVRVNGVIDSTPASEAGLVTGDRILAIDGVSVASHDELLAERNKHQPGDAFTITYLRDGQTYTVNATFKQCKENEKTGAVTEEEMPENNVAERNVNNLLAIELEAFPNPTNSAVNIRFEGEKTATVVTVTDINGKEIFREVLNNFDGIYNNKVSLNGAAAGTVVISVQQGNQMLSEKVLYLPNRA